MKRNLIVFYFLAILLVGSTFSKSIASQSCARTWLASVDYITQRHQQDQASCAFSAMMNWVTMDAVGGLMDISCAYDAYLDFSQSLNYAAAQFEACIA
jgi:hypothetical protein